MHSPSVAPGAAPSWWLQEALAVEDTAEAPVHAAEDRVDVAIVGGGFTGLWTALALRDRDPNVRVLVLEADICGAGASGKSGGITHGYMGYLSKAADALGDDGARAVARAGSRAQAGIREFCERRNEDVWWRQDGIGAVRRALVRAGSVPVVLVRGGQRPGALAPRESRTRFSWSIER